MRKLATIQRITAITPIPGADAIERADVLGWEVVVGKGEFQAGDLAVYFEIDSWCDASIPAFNTPIFQPRYTNWGDKQGMRLKTIKLRKQLSQGLLMPVDKFAQLTPSVLGLDKLVEGQDVTELLGILLWEPIEEAKSKGIAKAPGTKAFPSFIRKTDQERVQNYINELGKHSAETFEVSIKLDGSSMTAFHVSQSSPWFAEIQRDQELRKLKKLSWFGRLWYNLRKRFVGVSMPADFSGVCSRNIQLPTDGNNNFSNYYRDNKIDVALRLACAYRSGFGQGSLAFQGELIGPSIQANHEQVKDLEWHIFDVFDIDAQEYLLPADARKLVESVGLSYVPVIMNQATLWDIGKSDDLKTVVKNILAMAEGPGMNNGVKREGLVFKSNSTPFSFKAISDSYLLKKDSK